MKSNKKAAVLVAVTLSVMTVMAAFSPAFALFGKKTETLAVSAFAKTQGTGSLITFSESDFTSRVSGGEKLDSIVISALPTGGILRLAGRELVRGEAVSASALGTLCFVPDDAAADISTTFKFLPVFAKSGAASQEATVTINLSDKKNSAPVALDLEFSTYTDVRLCAELKYKDADGDECTFTIASSPKRGTVEVADSGFLYTPSKGKNGSDSFTYTATDSRGNVSAAATVQIDVRKRPSKDVFQYTDMQNSPAHFAALYLRDHGVLIGETIGAENFLYPSKPVSRAEFVTLVAAITELALPTMSVGTGLADNADIPVWAQPYVVAAVSSGLVFGEKSDDGNSVFRADDGITRAEAASIINRALGLANDGRGLLFADNANVPTWATQAVINATAAEIMPVFADNTVRANATVTRQDAADMLYHMVCYIEESEKTGGLFDFLK